LLKSGRHLIPMFIYANVFSNHHSHSQSKNLFLLLLPLSSSSLNSNQDLKSVLDRIPLGLLPQIRWTSIRLLYMLPLRLRRRHIIAL
jgi:hypothetical protein